MTERYVEQQEHAADRMDRSVSFAVVSKYPGRSSNFTYGVDADEYPTEKEATIQLLMLLGHHVRHVSGQLGVDESRVIELAMKTSEGVDAE